MFPITGIITIGVGTIALFIGCPDQDIATGHIIVYRYILEVILIIIQVAFFMITTADIISQYSPHLEFVFQRFRLDIVVFM